MTIDREAVSALVDAPSPDGYCMRGYRQGDEQAWVDLLGHGSFSDWSVERFQTYMQGPERLEGSQVIIGGGQLVAASFASVQQGAPEMGRLDFVISHPDHRGSGLGRVVCTAVLQYLAKHGYQSTILFTDDWRVPAIGLYLSLGFQPRMTGSDMPSRWDAIIEALNETK